MSDDGMLGPKETWSEAQWQGYRKLPWLSRRMTDLMLMFPRVGQWLARRELAKLDRADAESEKLRAGMQKLFEENKAGLEDD